MYLSFAEPFNKFSLGTSLLCTLLTLLPGLSISIGNESGSGQVHKVRRCCWEVTEDVSRPQCQWCDIENNWLECCCPLQSFLIPSHNLTYIFSIVHFLHLRLTVGVVHVSLNLLYRI